MTTTQTLAEVTDLAIGGIPCRALLYDLLDQPRHAHVMPIGIMANWAATYPEADPNTILDLVLYEPHMPGPDLAAGLDGRLVQLAAAKSAVSIEIPNPSVLQPLLDELAVEPINEAI